MKAKLTTLPGAALTLLITLGFTRNPAALARILILCLVALVAAPIQAAPPGGGGGTGGGTIYYVGPWAGVTQGGTAVMTTMNSDGSGKTTLGLGMFGNPSWVLYNNHRWFIYTYVIPDQYYPDGITRRSEVFALRDDFHQTLNNNANTTVQLTDDVTLQPRVGSTDWVPGGAQISFKGRRWSSAEQGATVVEGGIYTASLAFGTDGNIVGLAEQPATAAIPFPLVETPPGDPWPALANNFCWNPTGDVVAYENAAQNELWLADLVNVHIRIHSGQAKAPQWSPDGALIAFTNGSGIATIKPDGTGYKVIVPKTSTWFFADVHFSPTGAHIVYTGWQQNASSNSDVFRATAKGTSRVNLTNTSTPFNEGTHPGAGAGWR
ncbi:MAG: TolB family protein [Verrucomicrobiales bacterium]